MTTNNDKISVILEEYRQLYGLLLHRFQALERRIPVAGATLMAFLGSVTVLPPDGQVLLLFFLPVSLIFYVRTTVSHVLSKEDLLRRIDEIERQVNLLVGEELLTFQSRHPSRSGIVGGRTGREARLTVYVTALLLLAGCGYLSTPLLGTAYWVYLLASTAYLTACVCRTRDYRYVKSKGGGASPVLATRL